MSDEAEQSATGQDQLEEDRALIDHPLFAFGVFMAMLVVIVILWWLVPSVLTAKLVDVADKGVNGDSYGSVNALFTGLAFAGLVFTILLQLRELRLQRKDFSRQLKEMRESRGEVKIQNEIARRHSETAFNQNETAKRQVLTAQQQIQVQLLELEIRAIEMKSTLDIAQHGVGSSHYIRSMEQKIADFRTRHRL